MPSEKTIVNSLRQICKAYFNLDLNRITFRQELELNKLAKDVKEQLVINFEKANPQLKQFEIPVEHKLIASVVITIINSVTISARILNKNGIRVMVGDPIKPRFDPPINDSNDYSEEVKHSIDMMKGYYKPFRAIVNYLLKADPDKFETPFLASAKQALVRTLSELYDVIIPE